MSYSIGLGTTETPKWYDGTIVSRTFPTLANAYGNWMLIIPTASGLSYFSVDKGSGRIVSHNGTTGKYALPSSAEVSMPSNLDRSNFESYRGNAALDTVLIPVLAQLLPVQTPSRQVLPSASSPSAIPWPLIGLGAAGLLVVGYFVFGRQT